MPRRRAGLVVVEDADLAVVDRRHAVLVEDVPLVHVGEPERTGRGRPRVPGRAGCRRPRRARHPCGLPAVSSFVSISLASPDCRIRSVSPLSPLERRLHVVRDRERVVGDEHDLARRLAVVAATRDGERRLNPSPTQSARSTLQQTVARSFTRHPPDSGGSPAARRAERTPWPGSPRTRSKRRDWSRARRLPGLVGEPVSTDSFGRAVEREQRDGLSGLARERARAAHDVDTRRSDERVDLRARVPLVPEQEDAEGVVEPSATAREHEDLRGGRGGDVERELEVGRVLVDRVPHDPRLRRRGRSDRLGDAESKSPTATATSRLSARACSSPPSAATTTAPSGTRSNRRRGDSPPATATTTLFSDTPSSAGITQVEFREVGGASSRPLQPGCPSSPLRSCHRSACSARGRAGGRGHRRYVQPVPGLPPAPGAVARLPGIPTRRAGPARGEGPGLSRRTMCPASRSPANASSRAAAPRRRPRRSSTGCSPSSVSWRSSSSGTSCPRTRGRRRRTDRRRARKSRQGCHRAFAGAREARRRRRAGGARRPRRRLRPSSVTRRRAGVPGGAG